MKKLLRDTFINGGDRPTGRRVPEGGRRRNGCKRHSIKARALLIVVFLLIHLSVLSLLVELVRAQEASFRVVSDASAKYSYMEEPGWETLGFDDSAWSSVIAPSAGLCDPSVVDRPGPPKPIWGENPQEFQTIFVRKTFTLDAAATANIIVLVDDDYDLFVNGVFIGGNHDGVVGGDLYTDVPLQAGLNVLAIMAIDVAGGCQWLTFDVFPPPLPPANDDVANAVVVSALDFTDRRDTHGATTSPEDPGSCLGGTRQNVWYTFTPSENTIIRVTTGGSSYDAFLDVFVSSAGELIHTGLCGFGQLDFEASAGTTYYFMVSSDVFGGDLVFSVLSLGPPFQVNLNLDAIGSFNPQTGSATIGGIVTCNEPAGVFVSGVLREKQGRRIITGSFSTDVPCDGATPWSTIVRSDQGAFGGGRVEILASAFGCGPVSCDEDQETTTVRLRGKQ